MQQDTADHLERPMRQLFQYLCSHQIWDETLKVLNFLAGKTYVLNHSIINVKFCSFVSYSSFNHICKCLDSTANRAILSLLFKYYWRALYIYIYIYIYICVCVYVCVCASVCPTTLHHLMRLYDWCAIIKAQQVEYHPWAKHLENNII